MWVIEGVATYGARLAASAGQAGYEIVEATRMDDRAHRGTGKSDPLDARRIAAAVLALEPGKAGTGSLLVKSPRWSRVSAGHPSRSRTSRVAGTPRSRTYQESRPRTRRPAPTLPASPSCPSLTAHISLTARRQRHADRDQPDEARGARHGGIRDGRLTLPLDRKALHIIVNRSVGGPVEAQVAADRDADTPEHREHAVLP